MDATFWLLGAAACAAGFVDAVAGGGGLLQLPALLILRPAEAPGTLFGTNKLAAVWGTLAAATRYARRVEFDRTLLVPALLAALAGAWTGARAVTALPAELLRPLVLVLLVAVAAYTAVNPGLGVHHAPRLPPRAARAALTAIALGIGFYDGFFGPGTGAFLVFLLVRVLGFDFLHASAYAKVLNVATNAAALGYFVPHGWVLWSTAAWMAACNVAGAIGGSHLALRHGSRFVRRVFLGVVVALIVKLTHDTLAA